MIRVLRVLEYEFATQEAYEKQFNRGHDAVPLVGSFSPNGGITTIRSAIFMPTVEEDQNVGN